MRPTALSGPSGEPRFPPSRWAEAVWRGDRLAAPQQAAWSTGYPALDAELPGGGWPAAGLTELLFQAPGSGELRLLAPGLNALGEGELVWIAPPCVPYAPALRALGLGLARLVWIAPPTPADAAWAAEQALRARCCAAVLWWGDAVPPMMRRLHLAAQDNGCPLIAVRPWTARQISSPAPLRLACEPAPEGQLAIDVFKRRGPPMAAPTRLSLAAGTPRRRPPASCDPTEHPHHAVARAAPAQAAA